LSQRIERVLANLDALGGCHVSKDKLAEIEQKEENLETIRKLLLREAYFLEE
jgi:hypothetical protein